jgi:Mycothiol maleylpyruvate isomerase N-terminal domain
MQRSLFLEKLHAARGEWEAALAAIPEERMLEPALSGGWRVKDVVAHVTWSEREMIGVIRQRALVGSPLWELAQDDRNARVVAENRDRPLAQVLAEERAAWLELVPLLESLGDDDLIDPSRFAKLEELPGVMPWQIFAGSTFLHHEEHARDLRAWWTEPGAVGDQQPSSPG